jgi:L-lysine exporter family protein LysE/ArgO
VWFTGLGYAARRLAGLFSTPTTWRVLDALIAATMIVLGIAVALG